MVLHESWLCTRSALSSCNATLGRASCSIKIPAFNGHCGSGGCNLQRRSLERKSTCLQNARRVWPDGRMGVSPALHVCCKPPKTGVQVCRQVQATVAVSEHAGTQTGRRVGKRWTTSGETRHKQRGSLRSHIIN